MGQVFIEYVCFPVSIIPPLLQTHIIVIHHWCYKILAIDAIALYVFTTMKIASPIWFINEIVHKTYNKVFPTTFQRSSLTSAESSSV